MMTKHFITVKTKLVFTNEAYDEGAEDRMSHRSECTQQLGTSDEYLEISPDDAVCFSGSLTESQQA